MAEPLDPRATVGRRIRQEREAQGHSQERLAERAGLDRTYISSCERGRRNISLITLAKIARALDVAPGSLLSDGGCDCERS